MTEFLIYDLKVAVLIAVFYMFYRLLLSQETFHRVNRVVLLLTAVASFVLPLCVITLHQTVVLAASPKTGSVAFDGLQAVVEPDKPLWQTLVSVLFFAGVAISLSHTIFSIFRVLLLIQRSEKHPQPDGTIICVTGNAALPPFSWMHYIVMNRSDYQQQDAAILAHERGHIRLKHSWDVVLVDVLTALQWFNPAMWMLRQDLRTIHEYEADAAVLSLGINARQYQYLLISKAASIGGYSIANGISHSTLKNRINMMLHQKSNRTGLLKLLALVPIVGAALALNAETVTDYVYNNPEKPQKKVVKKGRKDGQVKVGSQTIVVKADKAADKNIEASDNSIAGVASRLNDNEKEPLIVIDGKVSTAEQMKALEPKDIDNMSVVKNEETKKQFAKHFNADTSGGIIFINTKQYVNNGGGKAIASFATTDKNPQQDESSPRVFDVVEQMPEYPGGMAEMMSFLSANVRYPEAAEKAGTQGRVIASFIVEKDGSISGAKVLKSVSEELDAEALRVIGLMPKWKSGRQNGEPVRVKYTIPITFRLSSPSPSTQNQQAEPTKPVTQSTSN